jgi:hypothetical protein
MQVRIYNQSPDDRDCTTAVFGPMWGCECVETLRLDGEPAVPPLLMLTIQRCDLKLCVVNVHLIVPRGGDATKRYYIVPDVLHRLATTSPLESDRSPQRRSVAVVAGDFNLKPWDLRPSYWEDKLPEGQRLIWDWNVNHNRDVDGYSPNDHIFAVSLDGRGRGDFMCHDLTQEAFDMLKIQETEGREEQLAAVRTIPHCLKALHFLSTKLVLENSAFDNVALSDHAPIGFSLQPMEAS